MNAVANHPITHAQARRRAHAVLKSMPAAADTTPQTKWLSLVAAIALHALLLAFGGTALYRPAQFGVQSGMNGIDVDLVAAPAAQSEHAPSHSPAQNPMSANASIPIPEPATPAARNSETASAADQSQSKKSLSATHTTVSSSAGNDGAIWNDPQYLANRPPKYPREALMHSVEGTTILIADIDEKGRPHAVQLEKSSGNAALDASALRAVRQWIFSPARVAGMAVKSRSRIPITFKIDSPKQN